MEFPSDHFDHIILGAEKQAAVSAAQAYPEKSFLFLTDQEVVDGWDLANVSLMASDPEKISKEPLSDPYYIPANARWIKPPFQLMEELNRLYKEFPDQVLPVYSDSERIGGNWIKKGNAFHKPDALEMGKGKDPSPHDPYGCEYVYQQALEKASGSYIVVGRKGPSSSKYGIVRSYGEGFGREAFLLSGETTRDKELEANISLMINEMDHKGFFTMNWVEIDKGRFRLTSIRPVVKPVFKALREAGLDLLSSFWTDRLIAEEGVKFVMEQHYTSYKPLIVHK